MRKRMLWLGYIFLFIFQLHSQEGKSAYGISFHGFVKTDFFYDSRQVVSAREGHFLLYPSPEVNDAYGNDINSGINFNILAIQTRLTGSIIAPDAFGAQVTGKIEGAFFGHTNADINGFRLRHAFAKLTWENSSVLIGQYWNPLFVTKCFPGVVSFNTGVPFQPFARNPQIRFINGLNSLEFTIVAYSERDFSSIGPDGTTSSYLRNSGFPALHARIAYNNELFTGGIGFDFKRLRPLTVYNNLQTKETVTGKSFIAYLKLKKNDFTFKAEGILGQNLYNLLMIGGYGVKDVSTNQQTYQPLQVNSIWSEFIYHPNLEYGLFIGYTQNNGAPSTFNGNIYARGSNIKNAFRIAPRLVKNYAKFRTSLEIEYTAAAYGTADSKGVVQNTDSVSNVRILTAFYLFF